MSLSLIEQPAQLPILYEDVKVGLAINHDEDRAFIEDQLIPSAAEQCRIYTGRQLITATWELWAEDWCDYMDSDGRIRLPLAPVQSITHIKYLDTGGTLQTLAADQYETELPAGPSSVRASIWPAFGVVWPTVLCQPKAVQIRFVAGYGLFPESVPARLRQGLIVNCELEREGPDGPRSATLEARRDSCWWPYRVGSLS